MVFNNKIFYIVESIEWVISQEGRYIAKNIKEIYKEPIKIIRQRRILLKLFRNKVLHFGSRNIYFPENHKLVDKSNTVILTWYHGSDKDIEFIDSLKKYSRKIDVLHTSCSINKENLIKWGAEEEKIVIIPIGIDTSLFRKVTMEEKEQVKKELGIPLNSLCIGSFQKDGNGWGEGLTPKMIKGPDIFCEVIRRIKEKYPVFVLLTGPARGYVKKRLTQMNVPFKHAFIKHYQEIAKYYNALDLYVIPSRVEGGPKAMHESFASGIPVVSTDVGMIHDYAKNEHDAMVSEVEDIEGLVDGCTRIIEDNNLRGKLIKNAFQSVKKFDWKLIVKSYYEKIYSRFL